MLSRVTFEIQTINASRFMVGTHLVYASRKINETQTSFASHYVLIAYGIHASHVDTETQFQHASQRQPGTHIMDAW